MTCLELLPHLTKKQLDFEFEYFKTHVDGFSINSKTRTINDIIKSKSLSASFIDGLSADVDKYVKNLDNYQNLISYFSYSLNGVIDWIEDFRISTPEAPKPTLDTSGKLSGDPLPEPVCFLDFTVKGNVKDFCDNLKFQHIGERKVCYFGNVPYKYGNVVHEPQPYPDSGALRDIIGQLTTQIDYPNFNMDNYSCLITLYEDGESCIPFHSDNEFSLVPNSFIYTVSIGGQRELIFRNTSESLQPRSYTLDDGSVHRMSSDSQYFWEHSVPKSQATEPRISLTFRHLTPSGPSPDISTGSVKPPPIH